MELCQIEVPHDKITKLLDLLGKTACVTRVSARQLASVVGKIISLGLAVGPISRLMTRSLYAVLESRVAWCGLLSLSDEARKELEFWSTNILEYKAQPIWHSPSAVRVVYSDASSTGYGGYIVEHGHYTAYGQWLQWKHPKAQHGESLPQFGGYFNHWLVSCLTIVCVGSPIIRMLPVYCK